MDGAAVAIAEPQPKPPRRISDAPSARNLKPRHVSAVRRWPPGCGRFPPPPQLPTPSDQSQPPPSPSPPPSPPSLPLPSCSSSVSLTPSTPTSTTTNTLVSDSNAAPADSPPPPEGKMGNIPVTNEELLVNGATLVSDSNAVPDHANKPVDSPPPPEGKIDNSPVANGESLGNHLNQESVEVPNENLLAEKEKEKGDLSNKRWMNSKVYPPPKRRAVSAIRRFPVGCGRKPGFCLGLIDPQPVEPDPLISHEINHEENEDEIEANEQSDNADSEIEVNRESGTEDESESKAQEFIVVEKEQSMENFEIGVTNEKPKCEVDSMDKEPLVNGATVEPDIVEGVAIEKPNLEQVTASNEGRPDAEKPKCEEPPVNGATAEPDIVEAVAIEKPNSEQVTTSNDGISDAEIGVNIDSQQSKAIVIFSESVPEMGKSVGSTGKKKVVSRQKVLAKKNAGPKFGRRRDNSEAIDPLCICNDENAAMDPCTSEAIALSQIRPAVSAKKSVSRSSKPCLSEGKTKKKGSKVAKKSIRPVKDDNPISPQLPDLMTLTLPPVTPSDGERLLNARGKVKRILRLFQMVCRVLLRKEESGSGKQLQKDETETGSQSKKAKASNRIDLKAANIVKNSDEYIDPGNPVVGHVPGVEVGDEFRYRMELHLIGLHRPLQCGIDWTKVNGMPVATSIVASGGYSDGMDGSDVLIYTGSGGQPAGRKGQRTKPEDQKLEKGNLALKNSMEMKMPVRVIHGLKTRDTGIKVVMTFTYDGLYMVEEFRQEPQKHTIDGQEYIAQVFKYKLKRMPGQPELGLHVATKSKKCKIREGLCVPDISQGKEKIPICAVNTIDDEKPPAFKYVTSIIYPTWYEKTPPKGCDCTGKCSSSKKCSCAVKNGGEIAFNFNGAIIQAKPLIYECGPSCRCPPSCHNRVSQNGIKIPLEIFKTESRGWGVRSLSSIPSGSFICEYVGELLQDEEAEKRDNDEYLFDIGHNYDDAALWEGLPSFIPGIGSSGSGASASEGFTIDAAEMGNVGRFINHSCTPNLYAQNVLFDHDDKRMPHVMLFAAENIPPMQEMTYHYNYTIGEVRDSMGNEKVKKCYCGSSECDGRLY